MNEKIDYSKEENKKRASIFIDGSNLYHNLKHYKIKAKFEEIINILSKNIKIVEINYYTAHLDRSFDEKRFLQHEKFIEKIKKIPRFNIKLCNLKKTILKDGSVFFSIKGDNVHLATDLIKRAYEDKYDAAIIISGDEDFIPAIKVIQSKGKRVINAFFPKSSSYILREYCDESINLKKLLLDSPNMTKS